MNTLEKVALLEAVVIGDVTGGELVLKVRNAHSSNLVLGHGLEIEHLLTLGSSLGSVDLHENVLELLLHRMTRVDSLALANDDRMGNTLDVELVLVVLENTRGIRSDAVLHVVAHTSDELLDSRLRLRSVAANELHIGVLLCKLVEVGDSLDTGRAPGSPELEDNVVSDNIGSGTLGRRQTGRGAKIGSTRRARQYIHDRQL